MAVSQSDIDNLNTALANGEKQVVLDGQSITYKSSDDLIKARNDLQEQFNRANPPARVRSKRTAMYYAGRGYQ